MYSNIKENFNQNNISEHDINHTDKVKKRIKKHNVTHNIAHNMQLHEVQYNSDYRNVLNAINIICPTMGANNDIINTSDLPIHMEEPNDNIVKKLIKKFIIDLNNTLANMSEHIDIENGTWNDNQPERKIKSGWEKQQEVLGLPTSIYNEHLGHGKIKLVKIDKADYYKTDNDCKYEILIIIHKKDAMDQMYLKLVYVSNNNAAKVSWERNFFSTNKLRCSNDNSDLEKNLILDGIYIVGFLSKDFINTIDDTQLGSQKDIIRKLNIKKQKYKKNLY